jgi:glycosyltransferase involved in cell wall biosynthesis
MPKISVIIPSYNHATFIAEAIQSVLNQTFQDFEILIIDDGSKDNSVEVIRTFVDPRIHFSVNEENKGAVYTTNKMITLASSEYIALLNSDDLWETDKLAKQIEFMEQNKQYGAVFSNAQVINQDGSPFQNHKHFYATVFEQKNRSRFEWLNYFFNVGNCLCHPSILIRKSVYDDIGLYNPLMASLPDFEMWVRMCLKYEIYVMPEKLVRFRILDNEQNASGANPENIIACQFEYKHILDHFLKLSESDYEKVFNEAIINTVGFSLAQKALEKPNQFFRTWGLDILYAELEKNPFLLTPKDFTNLTRKNDIFNIFSKETNFTQLFLDQGDGITEENSIKFPVAQHNETQEFTFDLSDRPNIKALRLDPLNECCVIEIESLHVKKDSKEIDLLPYVHSNADIHHGKSFFFTTDDSQIYFSEFPEDTFENAKALVVVLRYAHIAKDALHVSVKQTKTELDQTKTELDQTKTELDQTKTELDQTKTSLSWRITKPLRKMKQILKGK